MKKDLIKELKADPNLFAECPCGESFPLRKAVMFYVDGPIPKEVQKIIIEKQDDIKQRRKDLLVERKKLKLRSEVATVSINIGKILEKVAPAVRGFKFNPRDCRALFEPIDYLVFNGLNKYNGLIDSLYFIDIKTGGAGLNWNQKQIKQAVENGKIKWDSYGGVL